MIILDFGLQIADLRLQIARRGFNQKSTICDPQQRPIAPATARHSRTS
jgi:hypothetical protein